MSPISPASSITRAVELRQWRNGGIHGITCRGKGVSLQSGKAKEFSILVLYLLDLPTRSRIAVCLSSAVFTLTLSLCSTNQAFGCFYNLEAREINSLGNCTSLVTLPISPPLQPPSQPAVHNTPHTSRG